MVEVGTDNLARANAILAELKEAGYSNKELNEVELIILMDMAANEQASRTHSNSL